MKLRNLLPAALLLGTPLAAWAQPVSGLYVGGAVGYNWMQAWDIKSANVFGTTFGGGGAHLEGAGGVAGLASVGWGFGNGFRLEIEGNYRNSNSNLQVQTYGGMVNALYDYDIGVPWLFPFAGVGAGFEQISLGSHTFSQQGLTVSTGGSSTGGFAAQAILGANFPVPHVPGLSVTAQYRFLVNVGDRKFNATATSDGESVPFSVKLQTQYNHAGLLGLQYAFNVAPPPPPPAPAPEAAPAPALARTYLVFFDWDKADLTDRARQIIADAAQASTRVQVTRIEVAGHTDTTGSAAYNEALSLRRARAVEAELVHDGVPQNIITVEGYGFSRLLVPTGPGVREPQNRRVEIVLH